MVLHLIESDSGDGHRLVDLVGEDLQPVSQSVSQDVVQSVGHSVSPSVSRSVSPSVSRSVGGVRSEECGVISEGFVRKHLIEEGVGWSLSVEVCVLAGLEYPGLLLRQPQNQRVDGGLVEVGVHQVIARVGEAQPRRVRGETEG